MLPETILFLYAAGGFVIGILTTVLAVIWLSRKDEQAAFRAFWG